MTCSAFLSSANKAEFLDLGYVSVAAAQHCRVVRASCSSAELRGKVLGTPPHSGHPSPCFIAAFQQLMERLQRIVKLPHRLRPAQTSKVEPCLQSLWAVPASSSAPAPVTLCSLVPQINSEYRAEFARCLEPLLMLSPRRSIVGSAGGIGPGITGTNM